MRVCWALAPTVGTAEHPCCALQGEPALLEGVLLGEPVSHPHLTLPLPSSPSLTLPCHNLIHHPGLVRGQPALRLHCPLTLLSLTGLQGRPRLARPQG